LKCLLCSKFLIAGGRSFFSERILFYAARQSDRRAFAKPLVLLGPPFFSIIIFLLNHPVNRDDRHLLAHAMASDFVVAWQFSQREQLVCSSWIKLHVLIWLGVSKPSLNTSAQSGVMCGSQQSHQSLTKFSLAEIWTRVSQMTHRALSTTPGVDVMITIFCDFSQFSAKNWRFS
jgi:hypothetical protein